VILWLKRSYRFLPHIERILKENEMPDDLKYIAIAESALRPHAGSNKGAIGFWQFMRGTGSKYGLVINAYIDERRNIFASTNAAVAYLKELYQMFKSWTLAAAAFNMGEEGLMAEILEQETSDYYKLYLSLETQRYIFRILAVKLIVSEPEKYGFKLAPIDYYPPLKFDRIEMECAEELPLRVVAKAAKTHFKVIKDLNPELRGHYLRKGKHAILIPKGRSLGFITRFKSLEKKYLASKKEKIYVVKNGDNLSMIAERFGVPLSSLIIWNRLDIRHHIHPGDRLYIFKEGAPKNEADTEQDNR
jgi:hypothetical protein